MMKYLISFSLILLGLCCKAQIVSPAKPDEFYSISRILFKDESFDARLDDLPDTGRLYTFFFKVRVVKNANNEAIVTDILASDTIAKFLFPHYARLGKVNYNRLMANRNKASFVIPVLLDVSSKKGEFFSMEWKPGRYDIFYNIFNNDEKMEDCIYFPPSTLMVDRKIYY